MAYFGIRKWRRASRKFNPRTYAKTESIRNRTYSMEFRRDVRKRVGVPPDKVTAYMWHLLAEFAGETRSRIARSQLDPTMTADQKSEANARAAQWLRRHHQSPNRVSLPARQM